MAEAPLLEATGLAVSIAGQAVCRDLDLAVRPGQSWALLGRNGAGKTTSFRMTIGMVTPNDGQVVFEGHDVSRLPMYKRARLGMGYLSQDPSVFQRLTVEQNLMAILETRPLSRANQRAEAERLMTAFGLTKLRTQHARTLSGGERRKLEIARALITEPSLILLDEPFSGVDPVAVEELQAEIRRLRDEENIAILITDHNVERTLEVCDRAYIIHEGQVLRHGPPKELVNDELVRKIYLGQTFRGDEFD
jgi:lipopolysaccharide export system ATP-binding protein